MNRAINSATAEKCRVRRVHDGIDLERCDVTAGYLNFVVDVLLQEQFSQ
jgi:hypothetical protein